MKSDGTPVIVVDDELSKVDRTEALKQMRVLFGDTKEQIQEVTPKEAEAKGMIPISYKEAIQLQKMSKHERALFARGKMQEHGKKQSARIEEIFSLASIHAFGDADPEERRKLRNARKRRARSR
jgi:hypothetical protein